MGSLSDALTRVGRFLAWLLINQKGENENLPLFKNGTAFRATTLT